MVGNSSRRSLLAAALLGIVVPRLVAPGSVAADTTRKGEDRAMRIRLHFSGHVFTALLDDTPSSRDLLSMLPLTLTVDDYSTNEKIAYLPRKLTEEGSGPFGNEAAGDLCYYAPWGNLALFHAGYRYSRGLIRLGRLEGGTGPLLTRGSFPLGVERVE
ncbi:cyclophilin-like fold protein [Azospirillum sp. A23]